MVRERGEGGREDREGGDRGDWERKEIGAKDHISIANLTLSFAGGGYLPELRTKKSCSDKEVDLELQ